MSSLSKKFCCLFDCFQAAKVLAGFELFALAVHLVLLTFSDLFTFADGESSFLLSIVLPQSNLVSYTFSFFWDIVEVIICVLFIVAIHKKIYLLIIPFILKTILYILAGFLMTILYILRIFILNEKSRGNKSDEIVRSIYVSTLGILMAGYSFYALKIVTSCCGEIRALHHLHQDLNEL